jgi:hypothetical protein
MKTAGGTEKTGDGVLLKAKGMSEHMLEQTRSVARRSGRPALLGEDGNNLIHQRAFFFKGEGGASGR